MNNNNFIYLVTFLIISLLFSCKHAKKEEKDDNPIQILELVAEAQDLPQCESVAYDPKRNLLYVSVQAGNEVKDGSIAKLSLDGKILNAEFITELNNPKGIAVMDDKLYVSDVTELVEIDLVSETIIQKHQSENIEFLNDVAIDKNGQVYVSDMFTSSIYRLDKQGNFEKWMSSPDLENPNGLLIVDNKMYIAAWGQFDDRTPINAPKGNFLKVDMGTKHIEQVSKSALGNLDGIQVYDHDHFLISDWIKGTVLKVSKDGKVDSFFQSRQSIGDILYLPQGRILALPISNENKVLIYQENM